LAGSTSAGLFSSTTVVQYGVISASVGARPHASLSVVSEAAKRLGITPRTLYRFIDGGQLPAYRFGRVIRLQENEVDSFIQTCRIEPGTLEHLYPEAVTTEALTADAD